MNVIDYLEQDHRTVLEMMEKLEDTSSRAVKVRTQLFEKIHLELAMHEIVEEKLFYPALKKADKDLILESYEEHHVVDLIVKELTKTPAGDETWIAKLAVMKENLRHHIEEERKNLFPLAKKLFDDDTLEEMAIEMQAMKEKLEQKPLKNLRKV